MVSEAFGDDFSEWYEDCCRRQGRVSRVKLDFGIRARQNGRLQNKTVETEFFGDFRSGRTRVKLAVQSLEGLQVNEDEAEVESVRGVETPSKRDLFSIRMVTTATRLGGVAELNWSDLRDPEGHYEVVWSFEEEEERAILQMAEAANETKFWFSGDSGKALIAYLLRSGLEFNHLGLRKVMCRSKAKAKTVFEVDLHCESIGDGA